MPDELAWTALKNNTLRLARVDYTGQDAAFLQLNYGLPNLGTTTSGTISERALPDGTAEDTVNLITDNAFAWANNPVDLNNLPNSPVAFGYLPSQLAANPTLSPPLAHSTLHLVVQIPSPGAPLPDLGALNVTGLPPGYTIVSISFHATASGTTPEGQQATLVVSQTGLLGRPPHLVGPGDLGFPAEVVDIQIHGRASHSVAPAAVGPATSVASATLSPAQASDLMAIDAALDATPWPVTLGMKSGHESIFR